MFNREKIENDLEGMSETESDIYVSEYENDFKHNRITRKQMNIIYEIAEKKLSLVIKRDVFKNWIKLLKQSGIGSKEIVLKQMEEILE